jgi:hypothetical protein
MTSNESMPKAFDTNPTSLAKLIFKACHALLTYLTASAARMLTIRGVTRRCECKSRSRLHVIPS